MNNSSKSSLVIKGMLMFWFIRILKPEWIISAYVPSLMFLKSIPTVFMIVFFVYFITHLHQIRFNKVLLCFLGITVMSTLFSSNRGISRDVIRGMIETIIIYSLAESLLTGDKVTRKLFTIYLLAFGFFGVWGIIGGGKINALISLNNEDGFGPFMCMGIPFSYFSMLGEQSKLRKLFYLFLFILCIGGVVVSFARGTFLSLLLVFLYLFYRSKNKFKVLIYLFSISLFFTIALSSISLEFLESYKKEMATIWTETTKEQTARDRVYLWTKAWEMFLNNPFLGVGPNCYSFSLPKYSDSNDAEKWGVNTQVYGRHVHNVLLQVLAEMGGLGFFCLLFLILQFWKKNRLIRTFGRGREDINPKAREESIKGEVDRSKRYYSLALEGAMIAFLGNGFFYNLLFLSWFWDLLILNALINRKAIQMGNT